MSSSTPVTLLLSDFAPTTESSSKTSKLLMEKFQSSGPVTYPIKYKALCATYTTLTSEEWTINVAQEFDAHQGIGKPSGLFVACKQIFDSYMSVEEDYSAFEPNRIGPSLWLDCSATNFYGEYPDGMESAFKDLEPYLTDSDKLDELEKEEEDSKPIRQSNSLEVGEGPYTNRALNWLKYVNGREGGDSFGDHAPVFKFSIIRTSSDYRGNIYETELIPMLCDCKYEECFSLDSRKWKKRTRSHR